MLVGRADTKGDMPSSITLGFGWNNYAVYPAVSPGFSAAYTGVTPSGDGTVFAVETAAGSGSNLIVKGPSDASFREFAGSASAPLFADGETINDMLPISSDVVVVYARIEGVDTVCIVRAGGVPVPVTTVFTSVRQSGTVGANNFYVVGNNVGFQSVLLVANCTPDGTVTVYGEESVNDEMPVGGLFMHASNATEGIVFVGGVTNEVYTIAPESFAPGFTVASDSRAV